MANSAEIREILNIEEVKKSSSVIIDCLKEKKPLKKTNVAPKRPGNIPREVWHLRFDKDDLPPLMPTNQDQIVYKKKRARIGQGKVRSWRWAPFKNPARSDNLMLYHWRRLMPPEEAAFSNDPASFVLEPESTYEFSRYNKHIEIPRYTDAEYQQHFQSSTWSREETDQLMDLVEHFDMRFIIVYDRWKTWEQTQHESVRTDRTVENLKERFYSIEERLDVIRHTAFCQDLIYDAEHERKRKIQLRALMERTSEQIEEEAFLLAELRRIQTHKRERERKSQDLQKLISQADQVAGSGPNAARAAASCLAALGAEIANISDSKNPSLNEPCNSGNSFLQILKNYSGESQTNASNTSSTPGSRKNSISNGNQASAIGNTFEGLKFFEMKNPGVYLRSQRLKLPQTLGQRKQKMIESFLQFYQIDQNPLPTHDIAENFNELRNNILLLHDLYEAYNMCDFELHSMRINYSQIAPGKMKPVSLSSNQSGGTCSVGTNLILPSDILTALKAVDSRKTPKLCQTNMLTTNFSSASNLGNSVSGTTVADSNSIQLPLIESPEPSTESNQTECSVRKKRAAALEQGNVMLQLKNRGQLLDES